MVLVIEGTGDKRRIVSVGTSEALYKLAEGQEFRTVPTELWQGWRKSDIHWDEKAQAIVPEPYPLSAEEIKKQEDTRKQQDLLSADNLLKRLESLEARVTALEEAAKEKT